MEGPVSDRPSAPTALPQRVTIREVGPRDGLQSERPLPVEVRARLISALSRTGLPKVEAVSFVSPKKVPAMAGAAEVWRLVERNPGVRYSALVPNRKGAEAALEVGGFDYLSVFIAASDGYSLHNVGKPVAESLRDVGEAVALALEAGLPVDAAVSTSFGDPFEGDVPPEQVLDLVARLLDLGISSVSLADTTGMATPTRVWELVGRFRARFPGVPLNLHFHDTRGTAMANVLAAMQVGVDDFDASIGGLGGSPFAPGAGGNVATEDLVHMLMDMGVETGVARLEALLEVAAFLREQVGHELRSQVSRAGPRWWRAAGEGRS